MEKKVKLYLFFAIIFSLCFVLTIIIDYRFRIDLLWLIVITTFSTYLFWLLFALELKKSKHKKNQEEESNKF